MFGPRVTLALVFFVGGLGCQSETDEPTATAVPPVTSMPEVTSSGSTMTTGAMTGATEALTTEATTIEDGCSGYAAGGWNQCQVGNVSNNSKCEWVEGSGEGVALCLNPTSGSFNVCGIRDCVDVCDCFAPPTTGTAVPVCSPILGGGANGCALYCAGGQICPDGMTCHSGHCYWPN